jgi:2-dehydropantoate 2-reductase
VNILVYGAGVIGTLYAARFEQAGHHVTVLARASRLADIQRHGLVLEDLESGARTITRVALAERLCAEDGYDLAIIAVRRDQLAGILPDLAANEHIPTLLFMLNQPLGSAGLVQALETDRVLLGFPGAGGALDGHVVRFAMIAQQPTMLGEPTGIRTARVRALSETFRASGFNTQIDGNMDAWLSCHAFFVTSVCGAIYLAEGDCERLSRSQPILETMVDGVREGFAAVQRLGQPVRPFALKVLFTRLPRAFAVSYWRRFFSHRKADYIFGEHARHAADEMRALATDCRLLLKNSGVASPALNQLYRAVDEYVSVREQQVSPLA